MKKRMTGVWITCLLISTLAGCGVQGKLYGKEEPTMVMVWNYYSGRQKDAFDSLVSRFNETVGEEKGIVVTVESKGSVEELATEVLESMEGKVGADEAPDIFAAYADTAYILYKEGMLADIASYMSEEELAAYVPSFLEEGELAEDELYVLPVAKSTELFYLNTTDWNDFARETGADKSSFATWESLAEVAQEYYEWSGGKAFFGRDAFPNYLLVGSKQLGSPIFDVKDGEGVVTLDEEVMHRLWDCYAVPYLKGYYGAYGRFRSDDLKTGDLLACVASTASVTYYTTEVIREKGNTHPIRVEVFELPNFKGEQPYGVQQGAGMAVLASDKEREQAAVEFLKWFADARQNTEFSVESGYFPVKLEANSEENIKALLEEEGVREESLSYRNLLLSAQAVQTSTLYTNKPFEGSVDARNILNEYMTDRLDGYAKELQTLQEHGMTTEEAWDSYITEELFQDWLQSMRTDLEAAVG